MDKQRRQQAIRRLVERRVIGSQLQLVAELRRLGIPATQASVSRDMRELGLVKAGRRYVAAAQLGLGTQRRNGVGPRAAGRLAAQIVAAEPVAAGAGRAAAVGLVDPLAGRDLITAVEPVGAHLIVVRTSAGAANAVAIEIDRRHDGDVAGTVAGDDTIFIAVRSRSAQGRVLAQLPRPRPRRAI